MRSRMMFTFIQIWKREELYALENCSSEREIKWKGGWWAATVLKRSENRCRWPFFSVIPFLVVQFPIFAVKRTTASKKYCTPETSCRRIHPWGRIWKCTNPSPTPHSNLEMVWSNLESGLLNADILIILNTLDILDQSVKVGLDDEANYIFNWQHTSLVSIQPYNTSSFWRAVTIFLLSLLWMGKVTEKWPFTLEGFFRTGLIFKIQIVEWMLGWVIFFAKLFSWNPFDIWECSKSFRSVGLHILPQDWHKGQNGGLSPDLPSHLEF